MIALAVQDIAAGQTSRPTRAAYQSLRVKDGRSKDCISCANNSSESPALHSNIQLPKQCRIVLKQLDLLVLLGR